jgi:hypothetical protein
MKNLKYENQVTFIYKLHDNNDNWKYVSLFNMNGYL